MIERTKAKVLQSDKDTDGGITYYVLLPRYQDAKPLCFRQIHGKPDWRCTNPAGYRTWHLGTGSCYLHGGATTGQKSLKTGKYSNLSGRLDTLVDKYLRMDRGELLDLTGELALTKATFEDFMTMFPDPADEEYGMWFHRFTEIIGTIGNLCEKISRIDDRNTLTAAQVLYLRATVTDIIMRYIPDPSVRERAAKELASRMGGDVEVKLQRNEFSLPGGSV